MSDFQFAEPLWVHALWGVLLLGITLVFLERRAMNQLQGLVSTLLQQRLVTGPSAGQRYARHAMLLLSCLFAVIALMRPQWGFEYVKSPRASAELMIAIDVSRSMLAEDVIPNRLERAKAEVRDLLDYLVGDQVGLIAFAGRASVLAPMTPDFGFFRLVLDSLGPNSVGRGGTRLEEPIRKAIAGFKATGDVSRVLVLITDGEDQDSFPLEAAKDAAERGIRIIAIGFGSESGSEIPLTDPTTGARTTLRDSDGAVVYSRLDGDTLREMALLTDGVYVPAGTGSLDLESIYNEHIAGLMRSEIDNRGRVVRSEGFQWFVLASIVCMIVSVLIGQGGRGRKNTRAQSSSSVALLALVSLGASLISAVAGTSPAYAQDAPAAQVSEEVEAELVADATGDEEGNREGEEPGDARVAYNDASDQLMARDHDRADQLFELAISQAGTDGEVRYRATYGLGWSAAGRADSLLESEPERALEALHRAGDYFREAVRLQPSNPEPRHNLEIVQQRAYVLADTLAKRDEKDISEQLDELIERQRGEVSAVRGLLDQSDPAEPLAQVSDSYRRQFRSLSTQQRQLLSDSDAFAEQVDREKTNLESVPEEERNPEDQIRIFQLSQLQVYLQRAREKMGHTRRELRGRRGARAYRRSSAALGELKRARDQLRDPVQVLDALLRDTGELARYTQAMAIQGSQVPGGATPTAGVAVPSWLTTEYLKDTQQNVADRTGELDERLLAGVAQAANQPPANATTQEEAQELAQRDRFMKGVAEASPHVSSAVIAFREAFTALETDDVRGAAFQQLTGQSALAKAREQFLDLRRVIELAFGDQKRIQDILKPPGEKQPGPRPEMLEYLPSLREAEGQNIERVDRISALLEEEESALALAPHESAPPGGEEEQAARDRERFEMAEQILLLTRTSMEAVEALLGESAPDDPGEESWRSAIAPGEQAVRGLESLRRLFFSLIEHLRETAARQQELNDDTEATAAVPVDELPGSLGPLVPRQSELASLAGVIANALEQQSLEEPQNAGDPAAAEDQGVKLRQAAELTLGAQIDMEHGAEKLSAEPPDLKAGREHQDRALEQLIEALQLLQPPQEEQQQGDDPQSQPQEQEDQAESGGQQQEPEVSPEADPSQLLQEVRDREAERRRENAERKGEGYDTVERDW